MLIRKTLLIFSFFLVINLLLQGPCVYNKNVKKKPLKALASLNSKIERRQKIKKRVIMGILVATAILSAIVGSAFWYNRRKTREKQDPQIQKQISLPPKDGEKKHQPPKDDEDKTKPLIEFEDKSQPPKKSDKEIFLPREGFILPGYDSISDISDSELEVEGLWNYEKNEETRKKLLKRVFSDFEKSVKHNPENVKLYNDVEERIKFIMSHPANRRLGFSQSEALTYCLDMKYILDHYNPSKYSNK